MKKIICLLSLKFLIISLIVIPSGCKRQDVNGNKDQTTDTVQQIETGMKPYDKEADLLAAKYPQKLTIALAQLQKGVDFARVNGIDKLIEIINNPNDPRRGNFVTGDFYIFIFKTDFKSKAILLAHPNKAIIGKDFFELKDPNGKMFVKDIIRVINYNEKGWASYKWTHPKSKKAKDKLTYSVKFNEYILSDGFYLNE